MNPYSAEMMNTYYAYRALAGFDENCAAYIRFTENLPQSVQAAPAASVNQSVNTDAADVSALQKAVIKGLKDHAAQLTEELLATVAPLTLVNEEIIPALNIVGKGFENKTVYLPQLLMSAEAAKSAFECIKARMSQNGVGNKCPFVIATVKGDIHDIGKNIVKLLLENYGFSVTDLGRDVSPESIAEATVRLHAPMVGLSALMTTTVPAMEETIRLLREKAPWCKILVGGAVLTREYADSIGADKYAKDAMEAVRYAEEIYEQLKGETV